MSEPLLHGEESADPTGSVADVSNGEASGNVEPAIAVAVWANEIGVHELNARADGRP